MTASSSVKNNRNDHPGRAVLGAFIGFFAVFCTVDAVFVTLALRSHSGMVTDHPYERGLAYNQTIDAANRASRNYIDDISVSGNSLIWNITRKDGAVWTPTTVEARFIRMVAEGHDFIRALVPRAGGGYLLVLDAPLKGAWQVELTARDNKGTSHNAVQDVMIK